EVIIEMTGHFPRHGKSTAVRSPSQIPESIQPTTTESQPVISTQDESSATTHYPASTPSNPSLTKEHDFQLTTTEDDSQQSAINIHYPSQATPIIPSTIPPPPAYNPPQSSPPKVPPVYQISPAKATPLPVPASAQIQVHETPILNQGPVQRQQLFSS